MEKTLTLKDYNLLEVKKHDNFEKIKKSYHAICFRYHPDKNNNNDSFADRLKEINLSYQKFLDYKQDCMSVLDLEKGYSQENLENSFNKLNAKYKNGDDKDFLRNIITSYNFLRSYKKDHTDDDENTYQNQW